MSFKRQADTELNQDNVHEMDKEVSDKAKHDTWKKAPDDVLATRKYVSLYLLYSPETSPLQSFTSLHSLRY
jgi:acyl-CoA thioesterase